MTPRVADFEQPKPPSPGKARKRRKKKLSSALKQINLDAAGIDIGAGEHYVAVPEDRDPRPVRCFGSFTIDLYRIATWLDSCGIKTVAMESTGVYWIPLMEVLEERGFEVLLVDPHKVKNVPGRKTDVVDCQWIQQLHTYGLLSGAFRPSKEICELRAYVRQREMLIRSGADHVQRMQKALAQMNLKLSQVISDITGMTGMRIIRAILDGERDPQELAKLRHARCRNDEGTIALALQGTWKAEHLFALSQAVDCYDFYQAKIQECDQRIQAVVGAFADASDELAPLERRKASSLSHPLSFAADEELYRIVGVDLVAVPGLSAPMVLNIISEVGLDVSPWRNDKAFSSWMGLCPGSKISGGKVLSSKSRACANRAAQAFRLAAYAAQRSKTYIGAFYRRMRARMGPAKAITATAHKLARIFYAMLRDRKPYVEKGMAAYEKEYNRRKMANLKRGAKLLGFKLVPIVEETPEVATLTA